MMSGQLGCVLASQYEQIEGGQGGGGQMLTLHAESSELPARMTSDNV